MSISVAVASFPGSHDIEKRTWYTLSEHAQESELEISLLCRNIILPAKTMLQ